MVKPKKHWTLDSFSAASFEYFMAAITLIIIICTIGYNLDKESKRYSYGSETVVGHELIALSINEEYRSKAHHVIIEFRDTDNFSEFTYERSHCTKSDLAFSEKDRITVNYTRIIVYKDGKFYEERYQLDDESFSNYLN